MGEEPVPNTVVLMYRLPPHRPVIDDRWKFFTGIREALKHWFLEAPSGSQPVRFETHDPEQTRDLLLMLRMLI